jgi:hypothetical protein
LRTWADFRPQQDPDYAIHVLTQGILGLPIGRWTRPPPRPISDDHRIAALKQRLIDIVDVAELLEHEVLVEVQLKVMNDYLGGPS